MNETEFAELAAGYALHALDPADTRAFEAALAEHPEWAHHLDADLEVAATLADAVRDASPPASVRAQLLAAIEGGARDASAPAPDETAPTPSGPATAAEVAAPDDAAAAAGGAPKRRWGTRGWFALAASVALLVALGFGAATLAQLNRSPVDVAVEQIERAPDGARTSVPLEGGEVVVYSSASEAQAVLVATGLPELPPDSTFELWLVGPEGAVSAGLFTGDEAGGASAVLDAPYQAGDVVAVTIEPSGGSPTGQPTTDPIVAVET